MLVSKIVKKIKFKNFLLLGTLLIIILLFVLIGKLSGGNLGIDKLIGLSAAKAQCWEPYDWGGSTSGSCCCSCTGSSAGSCTG